MRSNRSSAARACAAGVLTVVLATPAPTEAQSAPTPASVCSKIVSANVVVLDQPLMFNRLGAQNVNGIVYALARDVINLDSGQPLTIGGEPVPGRVALRPDKRPRPLVLRAAAGDCLRVTLTNLLSPIANPRNADGDFQGLPFNIQVDDQVADRYAGFKVAGLQLLTNISDSSTFVGRNPSSLVAPGSSATYTLHAEREGTFLVTSDGAPLGGESSTGNTATGMFAAVNVQPRRARFFRSQVTEEELRLATTGTTAGGQPVINYQATYPSEEPWISEGKAGLPILAMLTSANELVHSDLNAIVAGPGDDGRFPPDTYPLESVGKVNPVLPSRLEPFREFTIVFHDEVAAANAFPGYFLDPVFRHTLHGVRDAFMINYGSGGIGSEIIANRLGVGPMHDCLSCAYEEFFLSSYTVGDPAMLVDVPANVGLENLAPGVAPPSGSTGPKASRAYFPDDPANVHHSYIGDHVKVRNLHAGSEHHVFHLHNHQWLFNPNDDNSNYIDAQGLGPGAGYTQEINFGSGNRNKTSGDAIFHCHFYPHFAQGMWGLWRIHDVFEEGTRLAASGESHHTTPFALQDGTPAGGARALPDAEIVAGTPIPALVPLPGKPMAPVPGQIAVVPNPNTTTASIYHPLTPGQTVPVGSNASVIDRGINPGFPFWNASIEHVVGQRPATPPLDLLSEEEAAALQEGTNPLFAGRSDLVPNAGGFNGGLPRHALEGVAAGGEAESTVSRLDFSKVLIRARPVYFPEEGTDVEQTAMAFHAQRTHPSTAVLLNGSTVQGNFITNGAPPVPSGPFHEPCVDDTGARVLAGTAPHFFDGAGGLSGTGTVQFGATNPRVYKAAAIQIDAVLNKVGYHYPQQRIITLWEDVLPTINRERPPEPFAIRFNSFDCAKYLHTNLVPSFFELDDYQVRTPTDIIGQHIHLPKWDLTTTDGAANGWNYEDGTLSPGAVRERIEAINTYNTTEGVTPVPTPDGQTHLEALPHPFFGAGPGGLWLGARTTIQRWFFDPVFNVSGVQRGLGTIFTHDHYGPSTHQQIGLYGSVLNEPEGSTWRHNETGVALGTRDDGGPTTWQAMIVTGDLDGDGVNDSHREFWFQASDFQHAYEAGVYVGAGPDGIPDPGLSPTADSFRNAIAPSVRAQANPLYPDLLVTLPTCPGGVPRPCPEAISASDPGMFVINYRNEPVGLRVFDPSAIGPDGKPGAQAAGLAGDLAFALQSRSDRAIAALNSRLGNTPYPALTSDIGNGDPFTPMMRAYAGDRVRVKVQMGGQEEMLSTTIHGLKWLQGGSSYGMAPNSGWRNSQIHGISEQFSLLVPLIPWLGQVARADYAYSALPSQDGWWSGAWGLVRSYNTPRQDLATIPGSQVPVTIANPADFVIDDSGVCPRTAPVRQYDISAVLANAALDNPLGVDLVPGDDSATQHAGAPVNPDGGTLVFNPRPQELSSGKSGPLHDPTAILYVRTSDLVPQTGKIKPGVPIEPLVLRAAAGECIQLTLRNRLPNMVPDLGNLTHLIGVVNRDRNGPQGVTTFNNNLIRASSNVGLHPQLVAYDVTRADGTNVGINPRQTAAPQGLIRYRWYAGDISGSRLPPGNRIQLVATPVELGGVNLIPADKVKQGQKSLVGTLLIEPAGTAWTEDVSGRVSASVGPDANGDGQPDSIAFRDFALMFQKQLGHRYADGSAVENVGGEGVLAEDPEDSGQMAFNYRTEPLWFRFGLPPHSPLGNVAGGLGALPNAHEAFSNGLVGGDPVTPIFTVAPGLAARLHLVAPHGATRGATFNLNGHVWLRDPYVCPGSADLGLPGKCVYTEVGSRALGANPLGFALGLQDGIHPYSHYSILLPRAGGVSSIQGDYLFRDLTGFGTLEGLWGLLRVQ